MGIFVHSDDVQSLQSGPHCHLTPQVRHAVRVGNPLRTKDAEHWLVVDRHIPTIRKCRQERFEVFAMIVIAWVRLLD